MGRSCGFGGVNAMPVLTRQPGVLFRRCARTARFFRHWRRQTPALAEQAGPASADLV